MRCTLCNGHASFDRTVFRGTSATTVRLCDDCASNVQAEQHMMNIKSAPDHETKTAAVTAFLKAVGVD